MKLDFYKIFVKDLSISDEELSQILQQVIIDIAQNTYIFRDTVVFNVFENEDYYDMKVIYETANIDNYNMKISDIKQEPVSEDVVIKEILYGTPSLHLDVDEAKITRRNNLYLGCIDIVNFLPIKGRSDTYKASMLLDYPVFIEVADDVFKINRELLCTLFDCKVRNVENKSNPNQLIWNRDLQFIAYCNIIPDWQNVDDNLEMQIRQALIDGIKYYASSTYLNTQNEQVSNILYQRYYAKLRQLKYNNPNIIVNSVNRKNANWNY